MNKIIYYYQEFIDLGEEFIENCKATHIIISSLHFGYEPDTIKSDKPVPYIHLNDNHPNDTKFDLLWTQMQLLHDRGVNIMVMLGGAGGAYTNMYKDYDVFYALLIDFLKSKPFISGIDLDIEENVTLNDVKRTINDLDQQFPKDFVITMAPLGNSLCNNTPGMGGFIYMDLYKSYEGKRINWFNGQFYGNFDFVTYDKCILNGYPEDKIVIGMLECDQCLDEYIKELKKIQHKYPNFSGVDVWELYLTTKIGDVGDWSNKIFNALNPNILLINPNKILINPNKKLIKQKTHTKRAEIDCSNYKYINDSDNTYKCIVM